jgi:hypothetical protein
VAGQRCGEAAGALPRPRVVSEWPAGPEGWPAPEKDGEAADEDEAVPIEHGAYRHVAPGTRRAGLTHVLHHRVTRRSDHFHTQRGKA